MRAILVFAAGAALAGCSGTNPVLVAAPVVGVAAMQKRGMAEAVEDAQTDLRVKGALFAEHADLLADVSVEVVEGRVLLTGSVPRQEDRKRAEGLAWSVPTVRAVVNEITVSEDPGPGALLDDLRISAMVRARLLRDPDVRSLNFDIETVEGVVHLMGLARDAAELEKVTAHAARVRGVVRVISHVYLYDDPRRRVREVPGAG
ncbi:MAG TPA: BON domain-containing protein [Paracoccaceae bacterium]|nr:BON domain-containing protein [Paracoccaceae bacterium]